MFNSRASRPTRLVSPRAQLARFLVPAMDEAETDATENKRASEAKRASAMPPPPPPPISPPVLIPAPAAGEEGPASLGQAGAAGCSRSRPPALEPERSLGRLRGRFEDYDEELEEEEEMEEEEEEEEEMSHFSLRLESGRADSEDEEEEVSTTLPDLAALERPLGASGAQTCGCRCRWSSCRLCSPPSPPTQAWPLRLHLFYGVLADHLGHSGFRFGFFVLFFHSVKVLAWHGGS